MGTSRRRRGEAWLTVSLVAVVIVLGPAQPVQLAGPMASVELDSFVPPVAGPITPVPSVSSAEFPDASHEDEADAEGYPAFTNYPRLEQMTEAGGSDDLGRGLEVAEPPVAVGVGWQPPSDVQGVPAETSTESSAGGGSDVSGERSSSPTEPPYPNDLRGDPSEPPEPGPGAGELPVVTAPADHPASSPSDLVPPVAGGSTGGETVEPVRSVGDEGDDGAGTAGPAEDEPVDTAQPDASDGKDLDEPVAHEPDAPPSDGSEEPIADEPDAPAEGELEELWPDAEAVADAWAERVAALGADRIGWDEGAAQGLWWALVEHCSASARVGPQACGSSVDAWMRSNAIEPPDLRRWAEVDEESRGIGYRLVDTLAGREDDHELPRVLPDWVSELRRPR
jgi:hypothetical protein